MAKGYMFLKSDDGKHGNTQIQNISRSNSGLVRLNAKAAPPDALEPISYKNPFQSPSGSLS